MVEKQSRIELAEQQDGLGEKERGEWNGPLKSDYTMI
jgi:hypothetical protein